MKILLTGGGTMGPVTPLLAIAEAWRQFEPATEFIFVGTKNGPERIPVQEENIPFLHIPVARLPRYLSFEWLALPFNLLRAGMMSLLILQREKPDLIISAGGFTGVPLVVAGWFLRVPSWIHQQDARVLLANRLAAPFARVITVAWPENEKFFSKRKTKWVGNPVRPSILEGKRDRAYEIFHLDLRLPTVLVFGGGGGSSWINHMMEEIGAWLENQANVIHVTGTGKIKRKLEHMGPRYHAYEFLSHQMAHALSAASVVVARAGMGTITELSALGKPAILIPLPSSAQEQNVKLLEKKRGAVILNQKTTTTGDLKKAISDLLTDEKKRSSLAANLREILPTRLEAETLQFIKNRCWPGR